MSKPPRLCPEAHDDAVRVAWEWFHDKPRLFRYGDYGTSAETDVAEALKSLQIEGPKWARDLLVAYAWLGARRYQRKRGGRSFHGRNRLLAVVDDWLLKYHGAENDTERREIIREALDCFGHTMDDGTVLKGIEAGRARGARLQDYDQEPAQPDASTPGEEIRSGK
jgi:hypothetical protein